MENAKFELPEGKWLVVIKNGKAKIRNVDGRITFDAERFLEIKAKAHEASKAIAEVKKLI